MKPIMITLMYLTFGGEIKLDRFEIKVEKVKTDIEKRIQESLDNPLAN